MPLKLKGYSAFIRSDGRELEAFDIRAEDEDTMSCWVPSETGKTFTVHWRDESSQTVMQVRVLMDGRTITKKVHQRSRKGECTGTYEDRNHRRPFMFAPLELTDNDDMLDSVANEQLGTVQVEMRRVERFTEGKPNSKDSGRTVSAIGPVHERSKKAGVHAVAFGEPEVVETSSKKSQCKAHGVDDKPFATFKFRYRPLDLLRADGIAPSPDEPASRSKRTLDVTGMDALDRVGPSSRKRRHAEPDDTVKTEAAGDGDDDDADDANDVRFLEEQLAMMQKRVEEAKATRRAKQFAKREVSPIHIPPSAIHEVIDLTSS